MSEFPRSSTAKPVLIDRDRYTPELGSPLFYVVGGLLCLTGIGALIGIPMIIAAKMCEPPKMIDSLIGKCPYCREEIFIKRAALAANCPLCRKRIVLKGEMFVGYD